MSERDRESVETPSLSVRELKPGTQHSSIPPHEQSSSSHHRLQASEDPKSSTQSCLSQHAVRELHEEARTSGSLGSLGRTSSPIMEGGGSTLSFARAGRGEGHPSSERIPEDQFAAMGDPSERGGQEERHPPVLLPRRVEPSLGCQPDDGSDQQEGHGQDPASEHSSLHGSSGIRRACQPELWRDSSNSEAVLQLGGEDRSRRPTTQSPTGPAGTMDRKLSRQQSRGDGDSPPSTTVPEAQIEGKRGEGRQHRCSFSCKCFVSNLIPDDAAGTSYDGSDGRSGDRGEDLEGRGRLTQGGEAAEEVREDRLRVQPSELPPVNLEATDLDLDTQGETGEEAASETSTLKPLTEPMSHFFEHRSVNLASEVFQDLASKHKTLLVEVSCSPESRLSAEVRKKFGYEDAAIRCSHWNGCDLGTREGVHQTLRVIQEKRPDNVWISPECGPYSPLQAINQRTPEQVAELQEKRRIALKQYVGASKPA